MFDDDTLRRLRARPLDALVASLEQLQMARGEHQLPAALRGTPAAELPASPVEQWLSLLNVARPVPAAKALEGAPSGTGVVQTEGPSSPGPEPSVQAAATSAAPAGGSAGPAVVQPAAVASGAGAPDLVSSLRSLLGQYEGLLQRYNEDFDRLFQRATPASDAGELPSGEDPEAVLAIVERLQRAQLLFFKFPLAAQAAFAAFVEEGRRYSRSVEGERWRRALEPSPLLAGVREIVSALSLGVLRERPNSVVPTALVDLLISTASRPDTASLLRQAFSREEPP